MILTSYASNFGGGRPTDKMAKKGMSLPFPVSLSLVAKQNNQMHTNNLLPSLPAKSRTIAVRLISMAMTGYYKTFVRPRQHHPLSMLKYDPVGTSDYFSSFSCAGEAERKDCSPPPPPPGPEGGVMLVGEGGIINAGGISGRCGFPMLKGV